VIIYIACGLTHVPRESFPDYVSFIHKIAHTLEKKGCKEVYYALRDSDPQLAEKSFEERSRLCYRWDREMVERADVVIAEASYPSTGLGIELQIAESAGIPIIICFRMSSENKAAPIEYDNPDHSHHELQIGEGYVSLMALGVPTVCKAIGYSGVDDGLSRIAKAVSLLYKEADLIKTADSESASTRYARYLPLLGVKVLKRKSI
jgi:Nucleoside 2-deoxyribosyltransferase